ncbi:MAG: transposase [Deltaproteobacteria bacterium]|nr:transposase [Deltaproteobacteria bacterium]
MQGRSSAVNTKRRSLRLPGYDYSQAGAYCVTVCGHERALLFGDVLNKQMVLNDSGRMVAECWNDIPIQFSHVELDEFVVMPNHIHGIVLIRGRGRGVLQYAPTGPRSLSQTIGAILRGFKSVATSRVNESGNTPGAKLWQRDYYEHIIRNDEELNRVRESINDNPAEGEFDRENPTGLPTPSQERRRRQDLF